MKRENEDDCELWSHFKGGDKNAFAKIYQLQSVHLLSYGSKICGETEILKDAIHDLFVELWNSRNNLCQVESVKFYLFRALRYKLIRAENKRQQQNLLASVSSGNTFNRFEIPVETIILNRETSDSQKLRLRKAIRTLSKRQQEVIQLRFYQGFSQRQIADLMNMNYQSVSNLLYNSLCRIKKYLKTPVLPLLLAAALDLF